MIDQIKGARKLIFVVLAIVLSTVGLFLGKIDAATFSDILKWVGTVFVIGNAVENIADSQS